MTQSDDLMALYARRESLNLLDQSEGFRVFMDKVHTELDASAKRALNRETNEHEWRHERGKVSALRFVDTIIKHELSQVQSQIQMKGGR